MGEIEPAVVGGAMVDVGKGGPGADHPAEHGHLVTVTVDGKLHSLKAGSYLVSEFKVIVGVPADYELDVVVSGEFKPLADHGRVAVHEGEVFVSHVRRGGSS